MTIKFTSKLLLFSVLLGLFFPALSFPQNVLASSQFSTGYDIFFSFNDNGTASVTHNITLTNLTKDYYATEYSLTTGSSKITNISGSDGLGSLSITTKPQTDSTILIAKLNQQVVGNLKSVNFKINYTIDSLAIKRGNIWDINVPQIVTNENVSAYKLTILVPSSFGKLGKMSPKADFTSATANATNYVFTKNSANSSGVGASFGDYQEFKFTLKYRYKNNNIASAKATIALPPDTEYQALYYSSIDPRPAAMKIDDSGNYLADYIVKPGQNLEVIASGLAQLVDSQVVFQKPQEWNSAQLEKFTKNDRYIESNNAQIQKKAKELAGVREIYNYVVSTLKYDFSRLQTDSLGRRGALQAFIKPENSICTDYTDLFIALARAKGIPARGLIGFGYTDNTNLRPTKIEGLVDTTILHAWPEYYDKSKDRWVQIDPTWGSTTGGVDYFDRLDTNHLVFVINGSSSTSPLPAGAYKILANQTDDVKVEFSQVPLPELKTPTFSLSNTQVIAGFPSLTTTGVENKMGRAIFNASLGTKTQNSFVRLTGLGEVNLGTLLPFEKRNVNLTVRSDSLFDNRTTNLLLSFRGTVLSSEVKTSQKIEIKVKPFFSLEMQQIVLIVVLLLVVASWVYPHYHHRKNHFA